GMTVRLESRCGSITARLQTDDAMRRDCVVAERGGWAKAGHGLNRLTADLVSTVGDGTPYYDTSVRIVPGPDEIVVLVVQHSDLAPGGIFCRTLEQHGARLQLIKPSQGDPLPETSAGFDAMLVLGGPQHAGDDRTNPHFPALLELLRRFDAEHKPVAGICLGCQLLARAFGGVPKKLDYLEFGFTPLTLSERGATDPLLDFQPPPPLMEFHEDSFSLPAEASLLVTGDSCQHQCFKVGNCAYGFQFHLEVDHDTASNWLTMMRSGQAGPYDRYRRQFDKHNLEEMAHSLPGDLQLSIRYCAEVARRWLALSSSRPPRITVGDRKDDTTNGTGQQTTATEGTP
ncbi:MAG: molybdopterin oxidoreductase, partial [Desulfofustis sp.]|nr:molybdopterin oxidoreductase [Desulfofustis sp.]